MTFQPNQETEDFLEKQQLYLEAFQNSDPKHFDMVPEILDYLTYLDTKTNEETGEITYYRNSLTSDHINFYRVIKHRAGRINKTWATREQYAEQMKCDPDSITKYRKVLEMPFEQLDGNSLIDVQTQYTMKEKNGRQYPQEKHIISGFFIWNHNNAFMETCERNCFPKKSVKISKEEYDISMEKMRQKSINEEIVHNIVDKSHAKPKISVQGGTLNRKSRFTPQDAKPKISAVNKLHSSNYSVEETNYTDSATKVASPADCYFFHKNEDLFVKDPIVAYLFNQGFDLKTAIEMLMKHGADEMNKAIDYVDKMTKNGNISNPCGYFRDTLEFKYYLPPQKKKS